MPEMHVALGRAVFSRRPGEGDRLTPPDDADQRLGLGQRHQAAQSALRVGRGGIDEFFGRTIRGTCPG